MALCLLPAYLLTGILGFEYPYSMMHLSVAATQQTILTSDKFNSRPESKNFFDR